MEDKTNLPFLILEFSLEFQNLFEVKYVTSKTLLCALENKIKRGVGGEGHQYSWSFGDGSH